MAVILTASSYCAAGGERGKFNSISIVFGRKRKGGRGEIKREDGGV